MSKTYRLPLGGLTTDVDQYVDEWTNIAEPLAKILEMNVYGFDPLITLHTGVNLAPTVSFPFRLKRPRKLLISSKQF